MALVSGPLSTVTSDPTAVSVVQVSVQGPRTVGTGVQTHESKNVAVSGGVFSHEIAPGPATLTMIVGNHPGPTIPILVDDVASQTLSEVVDAARLATGETQESLAQLVQQALTARTEVLGIVDDLVEEKDVALSAISDARGGALTDIGQAASLAITDIGTAESGALSAIGVEVGKSEGAADRAEDAADRAESAVNDGVGDGSVTLAKLAQDVKDQIGAKAEMSEVEQALEAKPDPDTVAMMISQAIAGLVGSAPQALDTVYELAAYLTDPGVASGLVQQLAGKAPTSHHHTMAQISNLPTVTTDTTSNAIVQRSGSGNISVPATPSTNTAASSKVYVDQRVLKSGTATTLWSGTQAQYDALPTATKEAAGFIAVIT